MKKPTSLEKEPDNDFEYFDQNQPRVWRYNISYPIDQVIGDVNDNVKTKTSLFSILSLFPFAPPGPLLELTIVDI